MRRQYQSSLNGSERGWINVALTKVRVAIARVQPEVLTILGAEDRRAISMPGGPLELGWALLAEIECRTDETPAAADLQDCVLSILRSCDQNGNFPATEGGPPDQGATRFLRAVLHLAKRELSNELSPEVHQSLESLFSLPRPEGRAVRSLYGNAGALVEGFKLNVRRRWLAFPFYATFGDLFSRHWTFSWLHSRVAEASRVVMSLVKAVCSGGLRRRYVASVRRS